MTENTTASATFVSVTPRQIVNGHEGPHAPGRRHRQRSRVQGVKAPRCSRETRAPGSRQQRSRQPGLDQRKTGVREQVIVNTAVTRAATTGTAGEQGHFRDRLASAGQATESGEKACGVGAGSSRHLAAQLLDHYQDVVG